MAVYVPLAAMSWQMKRIAFQSKLKEILITSTKNGIQFNQGEPVTCSFVANVNKKKKKNNFRFSLNAFLWKTGNYSAKLW